VVFIAGVEEGLLPLALRAIVDERSCQGAHLEEERRLLYVGMTRAIVTLYLTWCRTRVHWETHGGTGQSSRFLDDLPLSFISPPPSFRTATPKGKPFHRQLSLFS
jgi:DNA helicase II / ATP-dependent DNA helicase PcrA